jgi:hypothetical protein
VFVQVGGSNCMSSGKGGFVRWRKIVLFLDSTSEGLLNWLEQ